MYQLPYHQKLQHYPQKACSFNAGFSLLAQHIYQYISHHIFHHIAQLNSIHLACLLIFNALLLTNCSDDTKDYVKLSGPTMGTSYSVTYLLSGNKKDNNKDNKPPKSEQLKAQIDALLENIEQSMSTYRDDSELSRINQAPLNTWLTVSPELNQVIKKSQQISDISEGAFDITVGPLVNRWGFGSDFLIDNIPNDSEIALILKDQVGMRFLQIDSQQARLRKLKNVRLDLSAIAKGYGVDRVAELLLNQGIRNFLVEVGGELKASGKKKNGTPWRVAVEKPIFDTFAKKRGIESVLDLKSIAIASSGDYRNFFKDDDKIYSHTINPKTGKPVDHLLSSVTVLHTHCMDADALATAFMVMGPEKTLAYAEKNKLPVLMLVREEHKSSSSPNKEPNVSEPNENEPKTKTIMSTAMQTFISEVKPR